MLTALVHWRIRRAYEALASGNPERAIQAFSSEGRFVFPGSHAAATDCRGRASIADWFERFAALKPQFELLDVIVGGSPWDMRVAIRFLDRIGDDYRNEGMQYVRMKWGRIMLDQIYLDTQAVERWTAEHPHHWSVGR